MTGELRWTDPIDIRFLPLVAQSGRSRLGSSARPPERNADSDRTTSTLGWASVSAAQTSQPAPDARTWLAARLYEPSMWLGERAGMRARRHRLLQGAYGRTVEIGSGTGLNLAHYPAAVDELILTEPDPGMRERLRRRTARERPGVAIVPDQAAALSLADGSVDTVVATLVLCTVDDPVPTLREIARVLRPGGQLLFIEHVRAQSPRLARWQDRLERPWRRYASGCRCNRDTLTSIGAAGFIADVWHETWRGVPPLVRPLIVGRATPAARVRS
jgi:SAM-dependent methyltransferase